MSRYKLNYLGQEIDTNISKFFNSLNTVIVTAPTGSTITMSKGNVSDPDYIILDAIEEDGKWTFHPMEFGTWSINKNSSSSTDYLIISEIGIHSTTIS